VDDAVGGRGTIAQAVEVIDGSTVHLDTGSRQRGGGVIRPGQADDLMI
jgi:hypothetical protein